MCVAWEKLDRPLRYFQLTGSRQRVRVLLVLLPQFSGRRVPLKLNAGMQLKYMGSKHGFTSGPAGRDGAALTLLRSGKLEYYLARRPGALAGRNVDRHLPPAGRAERPPARTPVSTPKTCGYHKVVTSVIVSVSHTNDDFSCKTKDSNVSHRNDDICHRNDVKLGWLPCHPKGSVAQLVTTPLSARLAQGSNPGGGKEAPCARLQAGAFDGQVVHLSAQGPG